MAEKLSLSEVQNMIRDSLYLSLPDFYWIVAEISEVKENYAGHCYLELIEKHPDEKNVRARIRATIWSNRYRFLKSLFTNITGENLMEGMKILLKAKIEYHEIYGLSLNITDIDPSFTIGEMAVRKQMVIKKLEEEGVFKMNQELNFPIVPQRIAIISSPNAAGYSDFLKHLKTNNFGYIFYTGLFEAVMQGSETEESIVNALDRIAEHQTNFDLVAIIRGGGSVSDLSWFDSYKIAYHVTQFPLPVITGIGHDKDVSVTDLVAWKTFKTPTASADFLIESMLETDTRINELSTLIADTSKLIVDEYKNKLENNRLRLVPVSKLLLSDYRAQINSCMIELISCGKDFIAEAGNISKNHTSRLNAVSLKLAVYKINQVNTISEKLRTLTISNLNRVSNLMENFEKGLKSIDPQNVLKRGYTITTLNGQILKSAGNVSHGDEIETVFHDGKLQSKISGKEKF